MCEFFPINSPSLDWHHQLYSLCDFGKFYRSFDKSSSSVTNQTHFPSHPFWFRENFRFVVEKVENKKSLKRSLLTSKSTQISLRLAMFTLVDILWDKFLMKLLFFAKNRRRKASEINSGKFMQK